MLRRPRPVAPVNRKILEIHRPHTTACGNKEVCMFDYMVYGSKDDAVGYGCECCSLVLERLKNEIKLKTGGQCRIQGHASRLSTYVAHIDYRYHDLIDWKCKTHTDVCGIVGYARLLQKTIKASDLTTSCGSILTVNTRISLKQFSV